MAWVSETGRPLAARRSEGEASEPLAEAVEAYILAGPGGSGEAGSALDRAIESARHEPRSPHIADAVESLLRYSAREEGALDRARALVSPGVAALLVARLCELQDGGRRSSLLQHLPELGSEIREATLDALRNPPAQGLPSGGARNALVRLLGTLARNEPGLLEGLVKDPDWRVVGAVIAITSERGGDAAVQILTLALTHDHPRVRRRALVALRKLGGSEAGELALSSITDHDRSVRAEAARTVGHLNVERAPKALLERLSTEDHPDVLLASIDALGELRDPSAVMELERWTEHRTTGERDFELRSAALRALHRIGSLRALHILEEASRDGDPRVQALVEGLRIVESSPRGPSALKGPPAED